MSMNNKYFSIISKTKEELDIEKELVNSIKNDKDFVDEVIRPLKISHELFMDYLFAFVDAQKEFHNCKNCQGFDKCPNAHKGMRAILTNDKKFVSTKYEMCQYYLDDKRIKNCFIYNEFPAQFSDTFLKHMKLFSNGYRQLLKLALNKKIKEHDKTWIYVYGDKNTSKTEFLVAYANSYAKKQYGKVAFLNVDETMNYVKDIFYRQKELYNEFLEKLMNVDLLILDGFNKETFINNVLRDQFLLRVIKYRYENDLETCISARFDLNEFTAFLAINRFGESVAYDISNYIHKKIEKQYKLEHLIL